MADTWFKPVSGVRTPHVLVTTFSLKLTDKEVLGTVAATVIAPKVDCEVSVAEYTPGVEVVVTSPNVASPEVTLNMGCGVVMGLP